MLGATADEPAEAAIARRNEALACRTEDEPGILELTHRLEPELLARLPVAPRRILAARGKAEEEGDRLAVEPIAQDLDRLGRDMLPSLAPNARILIFAQEKRDDLVFDRGGWRTLAPRPQQRLGKVNADRRNASGADSAGR